MAKQQSVYTSISFLQKLIMTYPKDSQAASGQQRTQYGQRQSQNPNK